MQRNRHLLICFALLAVPALRADVTLRYETKTTLNPALPPQLTQSMMQGMSMAVPEMSAQQFRNGKVFYSQGKTNLIVDTAKKEITLLDGDGKRYATVPAAQYGDEVKQAVPEVPEQAKALLGSMKMHAEAAPAGGTATIQGIEAEEHGLILTLDAPAGQGLPVSGPLARMVIHLWTAKGSEALRVQALREVTGYNLMSIEAINPIATIQKSLQIFPGMADAMTSLMKEMGNSPMLRMRLDLFMPMMAALTGQTGGDPNAPLAQINMELSQISTDAIADSVFQVPGDYAQSTVADILKAALPKAPAPAGIQQK
jgi:hypothetical protein